MRRPVIGITVHTRVQRAEAQTFEVGAAYARAVHDAGGLPVILPVLDGGVPDLLDRLQGVVLTGGERLPTRVVRMRPLPTLESINPVRYAFERRLILDAVSRRLPLLGICRGMQMLNETLGGHIVGPIADEVANPVTHYQRLPGWRPTHDLIVQPGSRLADIIGGTRTRVNSFHRQAVDAPGAGLRITARAEDGVVEAIEGVGNGFVLGVQFHPEKLVARNDEWLRLFRVFSAAAQS